MNKVLLILMLVSSIGLQSQTLDDYLKEAAENNPGLQARYSDFESSMQRIAQSKALPDPTLSFGYFISPVETKVGPQQAKFGLTQMFPWFGTLTAKGDVASLMAEAKYQEFLNTKNELYYKVKEAWYPLFEVNSIMLLQIENREILATFKDLSVISFKNGKGSMVDVIRVDIMIENTDTEIKLLEDKNKPLITRFNNLLNRADTIPVTVVDSLSVLKVVENYRKDSLLSTNPMLAAFDLKIKSAQAREEVAHKQGLPNIGIGLDYVIVGESNISVPDNGKDVIMPMVTVSLPIFRGKYKAAVKEAQFTKSSFTLYKEDYKNYLVYSYDMNWYELDKAGQLIQLYDVQITKTKQAITLLLTEYSNSGKDFEEILRMQQELLKYQISKTKALRAYYTALAKLDYLTAKPD